MPRTRQAPAERRAFTFVELVLVVMIMGILAAAGAPRFVDSLANTRVDGAARRIVADLKLLRSRAIMKSSATPEQVDFDVNTDSYTLVNTPDADRPTRTYHVDLVTTGYPVDLVSVAFVNEAGTTSTSLKYDMYGRAFTGSSPPLPITSAAIVVASGTAERTVVVDPVTGEPRAE